MSKSIILMVCMGLALCSCTMAVKNDDSKTPVDEVVNVTHKQPAIPIKAPGNNHFIIKDEADIIGFWVGMFEPDTNDRQGVYAGEFYWDYSNKINICINKIEDGKVEGHSIVAGNDRPFTGTLNFKEGAYYFELKEPGDQKYDGSFSFAIKQNDKWLEGRWTADKPLKIAHRKYTLQKMLFQYNPSQKLETEQMRYVDWNKKKKNANEQDDYDASFFTTTEDVFKYNASTQKLTPEQVSNFKKADLFILRNAIYARHGYSFKNPQLRAFFDAQTWYIPVSTDVKDLLTETEKQNISLLLRYEKNAKEYYDVFGRG